MIGNKQINKEEDFNVFLDSNIYIRYNFNMYSNMHMKRLKDFINDNINVKLYSNKIVEKECLSAINSKAKDTFKDIHALRNKIKWDMLSSTKLKDNLEEIQIEDENELVEVIKENFYKLLNDFNVINIPIDTVDTEIIFENYFNSIPPFEEKKKKEFPDAFIIESIKMFQKSNSYMKMYIVSQDKGFLKAFENNENYICYEKIEDLLDVLNHKFYLPNYEKAIEIIKSEGNNIKDSIIDHIVESSSILVYYDYLEYHDVEVTSINEIIVSKPMINDIETNIISFTLPCSIELNTLNSYYDYDNSIWDQEEKRYYNLEELYVDETHFINTDIDIKLNTSLNGEENSIIEIEANITLNDNTLMQRLPQNYQNLYEDYLADQADALEEYYKH